jgi:hypothetical protein
MREKDIVFRKTRMMKCIVWCCAENVNFYICCSIFIGMRCLVLSIAL